MKSRDRIAHIALDEDTLVRRSPEVEHERAVAVFDLLEENDFTVTGMDAGPYRLHLRIEENRLVFDVRIAETDEPARVVMLSLSPFRTLVRDYFMICESYYNAIKTSSPSQIEAIDMGRRAIHNEGAAKLQERLEGKFEMDQATARRLFTLFCVLQIRA